MKIYTVDELIKTFGFAPGVKRMKGKGTQDGLADYFGCDQGTVSKWLNSGYIPVKRAKFIIENESIKVGQLPIGL